MDSFVTVTTPADTQDLTTLATVKEELGITGSSLDARLSRQIRAASGIIADYVNRSFGLATVKDEFWLFGATPQSLVLERYPVSEIISVVEDDVAIAATDYKINPQSGQLYRLSSNFPVAWCARVIVVAYKAGYSLLGDVPQALERACILMVKDMHFAVGRDPRLKAEDIPGVMRKEYWVVAPGQDVELPPEIVALIAPHRRVLL